ncbi:RING-H2 finger protein ATL8-like [Lotus japonicus]|uniref:RING-H2 finger protein ATL8-like n=1 Tax=Lotus japonicus TaxID=34305 RepID=UPI00258C9C27|nr:RING-H2 finger protein ATL8-like [Lotus japonicus]
MTRTLRILQASNDAVSAPPPDTAANKESDFVVIMAALLCALICVVGLTAIARCAWLRRGPVAAGDGTPPRRASADKGLKKKVLEALPKFTYVDGGGTGKWVASSECAICLSEFAAGEEVRSLPQCGHGFHVPCIDTWLGSHSSCPSCRAPFRVARCQKCGQYPVVSAGAAATSTVGGETEAKSVGGGNVLAAAANAITDCDGSDDSHSHGDDSGFLP